MDQLKETILGSLKEKQKNWINQAKKTINLKKKRNRQP